MTTRMQQRGEIRQLLPRASALLGAGQFAAAETMCRQLLAVRPGEPSALHLLGVCLLQQGRFAEAEQALAACLQAQPDDPAALGNRGIALQGLRRFDEALACYRRALQRAPNQPAVLNMRGLALLELKRHDEALASFDQAVAAAPGLAEAWCNRANALIHLHRYDEALASLDRAEALRPHYGEALSNRSLVLNLLGRHDEALATAQRALALLPGRAVVHRHLADALAGLRRYDEALPHYDRAIEMDPADGESYRARARTHRVLRQHSHEAADLQQALSILGDDAGLLTEMARALLEADRGHEALSTIERAVQLSAESSNARTARAAILAKLGRHADALEEYDRLAARHPTDVDVLFGRAALLIELNRFEEAVAAFDAGLTLQPDHAQAINDRALALAGLRRFDEAFAGFARAAELDPNLTAGARWNEALLRLLLGQFEAGWRAYECRWQLPSFAKVIQPFKQPRWKEGEEALAGKTILLHSEQGLGDVIQFCRYAPLLASLGARVLIAAHAPLKPLLRMLRGVEDVIANGERLPPFDFYAPLMSLPMAMGTTLATIPSEVPYLHADAQRLAAWRERLGPRQRPRIGLAWSGDPRLAHDHRRSIPLQLLDPLLALPVEFFCLSKFVREGDPELMRARGILHFGEELTDFAETAALASLMDLVISVDTSIAHLAGALALPIWLLIAEPPEYRWMLDREDSPWYPTARLFRQRTPGDWPQVIGRVAAQLQDLLTSRAGGA